VLKELRTPKNVVKYANGSKLPTSKRYDEINGLQGALVNGFLDMIVSASGKKGDRHSSFGFTGFQVPPPYTVSIAPD
jgi:hypothetical protein